jgi:hypothetical protein
MLSLSLLGQLSYKLNTIVRHGLQTRASKIANYKTIAASYGRKPNPENPEDPVNPDPDKTPSPVLGVGALFKRRGLG